MGSHAICPGSFDPVTNGHLDIIRRAASLFEKVTVVVTENPMKHPAFSVEQRIDFIRRITKSVPNVSVDSHCGLLAEYTKSHEVTAIVKGLRAVSDFEYELQYAMLNQRLDKNIEAVYLMTSSDNSFLSSSMVREIGSLGGDISSMVPPVIHDYVKQRLLKK